MVTATQQRIFELAGATLRARGGQVPASWSGGALEAPPQRLPEPVRRPQAPPRPEWRPSPPRQRPEAMQRAAREVVAELAGDLEPAGRLLTAAELYEVLVIVALDQAQRRRYRVVPGQVTFLAGVEALAAVLGVSRPTLWRRLSELRAAGLVATRRWITSVGEEDWTAGTLFSVRLRPGGRAKVTWDDLTASWRDLEAEIRAGRAWSRRPELAPLRLNASEKDLRTMRAAELIGDIALSPAPPEGAVTLMRSVDAGPGDYAVLAELFDLPGLARSDRGRRVDALSATIAAGLEGDHRSRGLWRKLIWQALRWAEVGESQWLGALHDAAARAIANTREGGLRRPGAAFVAALRASGVWDALREAPQVRVGAVAA